MYLCPQLGFHIPKVYDEVNHQSPDPEKPHIPTVPGGFGITLIDCPHWQIMDLSKALLSYIIPLY